MTRLLVDALVQSGTALHVGGKERHYLVNVRRHKPGDIVELQDPDGQVFEALLESFTSEEAILLPTGVMSRMGVNSLDVRILAAVPKGRVFDDVVRKLNEMGVARLTPVVCKRSVVDPGDGKIERWQRIATESIRQCGRSKPLLVDPAMPLGLALEQAEGKRIFMHPAGASAAGSFFQTRGEGAVTAAIGPEGGFTDKEVDKAVSCGFEALRFGSTILRIETAVIVASVACVAYAQGFDL